MLIKCDSDIEIRDVVSFVVSKSGHRFKDNYFNAVLISEEQAKIDSNDTYIYKSGGYIVNAYNNYKF